MPPRVALCSSCAGYGRFWIREQVLDGHGKVTSEAYTDEIDCKECEGTGRPINELLTKTPKFVAEVKRKKKSEPEPEPPVMPEVGDFSLTVSQPDDAFDDDAFTVGGAL